MWDNLVWLAFYKDVFGSCLETVLEGSTIEVKSNYIRRLRQTRMVGAGKRKGVNSKTR